MYRDSAMADKLKTRLFVDAPLQAGAAVTLKETQAHYLLHTLRVREGGRVALFNGRDGEWLAEVSGVGRRDVQLMAVSRRAGQKGAPDVWLAFAPVKNEKIDYTARRAVELGVSALLPVMTRRTAVSRVNMERLGANAVEAAQQCGRMEVPVLHPPQALENMLGAWPPQRILLYCDEAGAGAPLKHLLPSLPKGAYGVLIGPEGGFAPEERARLAALPFVRALSLGPRILRAETAALAALANVMAWVGDWEQPPAFGTAA